VGALTLKRNIPEIFKKQLSCVIDQDIFCVHGGIPRPIRRSTSRIQDILSIPKVVGINPPYAHENEAYQQVASDCIWSDPASEEQEASINQHSGFGESLRGGGAICFGHKAVTDFLQQHGFSYIMRAHEAHAEGVAISKGARVFTVFSTSKDHNQGSGAMAGCILVDFEKMQVINRSPAYRNQYVHRRDSVSVAMLSEAEINQRIRLGLVTTMEENDLEDDGDQDESEEEDCEPDKWHDFDEDKEGEPEDDDYFDSDSDEYEDDDAEEQSSCINDTERISAVNPEHTMASPPGSSHDNHEHVCGVTATTFWDSIHTRNNLINRLSALNEDEEEDMEEGDENDILKPMHTNSMDPWPSSTTPEKKRHADMQYGPTRCLREEEPSSL